MQFVELGAHKADDVLVSIPILPEGRMQLCRLGRRCGGYSGFNPHPARRPDATLGGVVKVRV